MNQADIQRALRLESIFMPYSRRQRDAAYARRKNTKVGNPEFLRFAHYTTAEAALGIIRTKRLWMRNATCMVDFREVQHGFNILQSYFDPKRTKQFADALDLSVPGAAMSAITNFNSWWQNKLALNIFVASMSEHSDSEDLHGRLSMWRAFGASSTRIAIIINIPRYSGAAEALRLLFSPVAYLTEGEMHAVADEVAGNMATEAAYLRTVDPAIVQSYVFIMLLAAVTCLKHEAFQEEQEWRAIYTPQILSSPLMRADVENVGGVPQHVYKLPLDKGVSSAVAELDLAALIDRIIVGPSPYPWVIYNAFVEELTKVGVANAADKVFTSGIPIRPAS